MLKWRNRTHIEIIVVENFKDKLNLVIDSKKHMDFFFVVGDIEINNKSMGNSSA